MSYNMPITMEDIKTKKSGIEYIFPINPPLYNSDQRTIETIFANPTERPQFGTSINQTTAIRIDDSDVNVRESWSSQKINELYQNAGKVRIGTKAIWDSQPTLIPEDGEFIVYIDRSVIDGVKYSGVKVGDGNAYLVDLPFVGDDVAFAIITQLNNHILNTDIHVTPTEKNFWDSKVSCTVVGETLELSTD